MIKQGERLIKFSSFSPTKIEELAAGSDENHNFVRENEERLIQKHPDKSGLSRKRDIQRPSPMVVMLP